MARIYSASGITNKWFYCGTCKKRSYLNPERAKTCGMCKSSLIDYENVY